MSTKTAKGSATPQGMGVPRILGFPSVTWGCRSLRLGTKRRDEAEIYWSPESRAEMPKKQVKEIPEQVRVQERQKGGKPWWLSLILHLVSFHRAELLPCSFEDLLIKDAFNCPGFGHSGVDCHLFEAFIPKTHQSVFGVYMETNIFKLNHARPICRLRWTFTAMCSHELQ